ncbi:uncharacterized protein PFLUO_LOCUS5923 [Penicillium psychrofluorescens]|uniref:uncharacterized protein n=1 Tax=Penicillium psychrofluorescens TaxID=3158075 RepID=UPI003CCCA420
MTRPTFHTALVTSSELLTQPWLSDLTRMVNASYMVNYTNVIKFSPKKKRLQTDSTLAEELGEGGFTVVAFISNGPDQPDEVIGTASMKKWKDDGEWKPHDEPMSTTDRVDQDLNQILQKHVCLGDYELSTVALPPDPRIRGKGIAGHLVRLCEEEILRRQRASEKTSQSPVRIMIRTVKENNSAYWMKQGFTAVGSRTCPEGFWDAAEPFTMWAMIRELSPKSESESKQKDILEV